jgi:signal transduction histidine kinase
MEHRCATCEDDATHMDRAIDILQDIQVALWVGLALAAFARWWSRRTAPGAYILGMFGTLAVVALGGLFLPEDPAPGPVYTIALRLLIAGIVLIPWLLFRFAGTFAPPTRPMRWAADALTAAVIAFGLVVSLPAGDEARPAATNAFVLLLTAQWLGLSAYAVVALWRGGRDQPRVARWRMRTLAMGATGLSVVLIIATTADPQAPAGALQLAGQILTYLSAPMFLLGFAPPRAVVSWWRRKDEDALRRAHIDLMRTATREDVADALLPHAVRTAGGSSGELRDRAGRLLGRYALAHPGQDGRAELIEIPMEGGMLRIRASRFSPYFGAESVTVLRDLAAVTDIALSRAQVLDDERRLTEELARANHAMTEFVAIASHDLRTPLTVVQGLAMSLGQNWDLIDDVSKREQLAAITRQSAQLARIVEDLLTVSRIDAAVTDAQLDVVDLARSVGTIVGDLAPSVPDVGVDVPAGLTAWVDPQHLARMLTNYLRNAAAYGAPPVRVVARAEGDMVQIRVHDSGPGVPADSRDRLFEKFWRADKAKSRSAAGTGLGLAIVRGLARAAGGDAWYEHDAQGHRFALSLPASPTTRGREHGMTKVKVLVVVEDDPDVRLMVRATLAVDPRIEIAGEAASAEAAIELARSIQPGLIILDHSLDGDLTGLEAAPKLKKAAPNSTILLFTAFDLARQASAEPAVDAFLPKARFSELLPTVRELLGLPPDA